MGENANEFVSCDGENRSRGAAALTTLPHFAGCMVPLPLTKHKLAGFSPSIVASRMFPSFATCRTPSPMPPSSLPALPPQTLAGYGDYSPSIVASQMMLFVMLVITFTLLPYQTSALVNALNLSSPYQRARYSQAKRGRHVVVTGHLDCRSVEMLVSELYAADYGGNIRLWRMMIGSGKVIAVEGHHFLQCSTFLEGR